MKQLYTNSNHSAFILDEIGDIFLVWKEGATVRHNFEWVRHMSHPIFYTNCTFIIFFFRYSSRNK